MKSFNLLKDYGLKLSHVAKEMGISESLLRYHLEQESKGKMKEDVKKRFDRVLARCADGISKHLAKN